MEGSKVLQPTILRSDRTNENLSFLVGKQWWKIHGVCLFENVHENSNSDQLVTSLVIGCRLGRRLSLCVDRVC